ncbi:hypothetical protein PAPYR_1527 [Paratrimastix pyriformis]|uniref:Uncharacterized protein n=1 Tax=Paratrimastix pyriformis TaxID=342808 RepID=A0ABQ8URT3_9EUKA|nr:hypothetical protein PAPYR_1527 [Paratrimastix pyriformis]
MSSAIDTPQRVSNPTDTPMPAPAPKRARHHRLPKKEDTPAKTPLVPLPLTPFTDPVTPAKRRAPSKSKDPAPTKEKELETERLPPPPPPLSGKAKLKALINYFHKVDDYELEEVDEDEFQKQQEVATRDGPRDDDVRVVRAKLEVAPEESSQQTLSQRLSPTKKSPATPTATKTATVSPHRPSPATPAAPAAPEKAVVPASAPPPPVGGPAVESAPAVPVPPASAPATAPASGSTVRQQPPSQELPSYMTLS